MLEFIAQQPQHSEGLAVETSPEAQKLTFLGVGFCQSEGRLNRLGAAAEVLGPAKVTDGDLGEKLGQLGSDLRGKAPDVDLGHLFLEGPDIAGMIVPEAGHPDAGKKIDKAVPIDVFEDAALSLLKSYFR